jgi:hypothetical protein
MEQVESPQLGFPNTFCCNCGSTDCKSEDQDTRVTRFFSIGRTDTIFRLSVPVCDGCRRTLRRRPAGFFSRLGMLLLFMSAIFGICFASITTVALPLWMKYIWGGSILGGLLFTWLFYRFRRPKPPQTSFYQPVRIKNVRLQFSGLMAGEGRVRFMRLAFTNPDYLSAFTEANQEAIRSKRVAITKA